MAQPAACACGQVLFDIGGKKPGDGLICPWCERKYRYAGDGKVELLDGAKGSGEHAKAKAPGDRAKPKASGEFGKPDKTDKPGRSEKSSEKEKPKEEESDWEKLVADDHTEKREKRPEPQWLRPPQGAQGSHGPSGGDPNLVVRPSVRKKATKQEIPGGVMVMIVFIVIFNGAAVIALWLLLPKMPDGSRMSPWGTLIDKKSIWPEIVALLAGHFVGFIAWSTYLYRKQFHPGSPPPPPPQL